MILFVDIGSSNIKIYGFENGKLETLAYIAHSFKKNFDPKVGISQENKKELFGLIHSVYKQYPRSELHGFGAALFRKFDQEALHDFIKEFEKETSGTFRVISHDEENEYLEYALVSKYVGKKAILIINVGGGSTEVVVIKNKKAIERHNIDVGTVTINEHFPDINEEISGITPQDVIDYAKSHIPPIKSPVDIAIITGGELTYMKLAKYNIHPNTIFTDEDNPFQISLEDFSKRNYEVFKKVTLNELERLMPDNPMWMHGSRACVAFTEGICKQYQANILIPSDSNTINGIIRKDFS